MTAPLTNTATNNNTTAATAAAAASPPRSAWAATKRGLGRGLALLGAGALASGAVRAWIGYQARVADRKLADEFVLELDLEHYRVVEKADVSLQALLSGNAGKQLELGKVQQALKKAAQDSRVRGLLTVLGPREHLGGMAMVQELRDALLSFRVAANAYRASAPTSPASGPLPPLLTVAFAPAYGESGSSGTAPYYLASASQYVYLQPSGMLSFSGIESPGVFLRGLLDKLGVRPVFFTREEYKAAANMFTQTGYTPAHRSNVEQLIGDIGRQVVEGVASARGIPVPQVQAAMDAAPLVPETAARLGLVDGARYRDQVWDMFQPSSAAGGQGESETAGKREGGATGGAAAAVGGNEGVGRVERLRRVPLSRYMAIQKVQQAAEAEGAWGAGGWSVGKLWPLSWGGRDQGDQDKSKQKDRAKEEAGKGIGGGGGADRGGDEGVKDDGTGRVAVIVLQGAIVQGPVAPGTTPPRQQLIDATKVSAQLEKLKKDDKVKAVVVRVSSPGGSALGSDTLHRALMRLRSSGKPVIISMGDVAASGGMFLAAGADHIVAQPTTITGSIGVVMGKFNVAPAMERIGITTDSIKVGANSDLLSPFRDLSPQQEQQVQAMMDWVYTDFLSKVAQNRGKSVEQIRTVAKGKVYTGQQALELGLVDTLGGLQEAIALAKERVGLPSDAQVIDYPPDKTPLALRLMRSYAVTASGEEDKEDNKGKGGAGGGKKAGAEAEYGAEGSTLGWVAEEVAGMLKAGAQVTPSGHSSMATAVGLGPVAAAVAASGLGGLSSAGAGLGAGGSSSGLQRAVRAVEGVLGQAVMLDGAVSLYSPEAHLLSDTM